MPISNTDLQELAKVSLDEYLRNLPVDQIAVERPFLKKLMQGRKSLLGAKQNVVENIRKEHGSNFTWAFGEETVKFNKRNTTEQASFPWRRAVDGLYIDYDRLFSNGIKVREGGARGFQLEYNERVQLINLLIYFRSLIKQFVEIFSLVYRKFFNYLKQFSNFFEIFSPLPLELIYIVFIVYFLWVIFVQTLEIQIKDIVVWK